jgi:hypothetical protein
MWLFAEIVQVVVPAPGDRDGRGPNVVRGLLGHCALHVPMYGLDGPRKIRIIKQIGKLERERAACSAGEYIRVDSFIKRR